MTLKSFVCPLTICIQCFLPIIYSSFNYWLNKFHIPVFMCLSNTWVTLGLSWWVCYRKDHSWQSQFAQMCLDLVCAKTYLVILSLGHHAKDCLQMHRKGNPEHLHKSLTLYFPEIHRPEVPGGWDSHEEDESKAYARPLKCRGKAKVLCKDDDYP